jgi:hypothetical protein
VTSPGDKDPKTGRFQPGNTGAGGGRPKGSRNKLGEQFISDLQADWEEHGVKALQAMRAEKPSDYVRTVASILPKETIITTATDGMTETQMERAIAVIDGLIAARDAGSLDGDAAEVERVSGKIH